MEPFTWIGLGAALMFAIQLARGRIDFSDPPQAGPPEVPPEPGEWHDPPQEDTTRSRSAPKKRKAEPAGSRGATDTVLPSTRWLTDEEQEEAAETLRRARRE